MLLFSLIIVAIGLFLEIYFLSLLVLPLIIIIFSFYPGWYKSLLKKIPNTINIEEWEINGESENYYIGRCLETVKNVIDFGDWYVFNFYFPHKIRYFVCQKDLLVEGSIEEFEKIFEGKIIRKVK